MNPILLASNSPIQNLDQATNDSTDRHVGLSIKKFTAGDPKFQFELLKQDRNQNGLLEKTDLIPSYGKTATDAYFPELRENVRAGDLEAFRCNLSRMAQRRDQAIAEFFTKKKLQEAGLKIKKGKLKLKKSKTHCGWDCKETLLNITRQAYFQEFSRALDKEVVQSLRHYLKEFTYKIDKDSNTIMDLVSYLFSIYGGVIPNTISDAVEMKDYAKQMVHEYHQDPATTRLEQKFGIDIRFDELKLPPEFIPILDYALTKIRERRPQDLKLVSTIRYYSYFIRGGGSVIHGKPEIRLSGMINPPLKGKKKEFSWHYAPDFIDLSYSYDLKKYALHLITHELGHLVSEVNLPSIYSELGYQIVHPRHFGEYFAEDYRTYLLSDGQRVVKKMSAGNTFPYYEERLQAMKDNFPLSN